MPHEQMRGARWGGLVALLLLGLAGWNWMRESTAPVGERGVMLPLDAPAVLAAASKPVTGTQALSPVNSAGLPGSAPNLALD